VRIGASTGNLGLHCKQYHSAVLDALARIIHETPKETAKAACEEYIATLGTPSAKTNGALDKWLGRQARADQNADEVADSISNELLCLAWFLDANIPFNQFNNPLFQALIHRLSGKSFASSFKNAELWLPFIYKFVVEEHLATLRQCKAYYNSFDAWSRMGQRFLSQSYHCIIPSSFTYHVLALDFISCNTPHWAEVLAGCLTERQEHWTGGMDPGPIAAGGMADGASDVQKAGKIMYGDADGARAVQKAGKIMYGDGLGEGDADESDGDFDMNRCQNHKLKSAYEALERGDDTFKQHVNSLAALFVSVSNSSNVSQTLQQYQHLNDICDVAMYIYNATRWEGRVKLLECALKLRKSLEFLKPYAGAHAIGKSIPDFLSDSIFQRVSGYHELLAKVDTVSRLFQSKKFPSGHLVPLVYSKLFDQLEDGALDAAHLCAFRTALRSAVKTHLVDPILDSGENSFVKAAIFHPTICAWLKKGGTTQLNFEVNAAAIENDIAAMCGGNNNATYRLTVQTFKEYLVECSNADVEPIYSTSMEDILVEGEIGQVSALSYWRSVVSQIGHAWTHLVNVASMLLALPAGESRDEFVFSTSGRAFTKDRNSLSPMRLEQITVIVMFIRNNGWSQSKMDHWVAKAISESKKQDKQ
jgi:hypothetical protein